MRFWDASAILPLFMEEPQSETMRNFLKEDDEIVAWWGTPVECQSSFARLRREGVISTQEEDQLRMMLAKLSASWTEIQPANEVRLTAGQLLLRHPLRAADSLQLAAALLWSDSAPQDQVFVCLDSRLHAAARVEGFTMLPSSLR
jgi:hypothetical protein